jgi:hypothetical protein
MVCKGSAAERDLSKKKKLEGNRLKSYCQTTENRVYLWYPGEGNMPNTIGEGRADVLALGGMGDLSQRDRNKHDFLLHGESIALSP